MANCRFTLVGLILLAVARTVSAADAAPPAKPPQQVAPPPQTSTNGIPIRQTDKPLADGTGVLNIFPITNATTAMKAMLFVPRYYDPGRSWPLLVEAVEPAGGLPLAANNFLFLAETRGFIILAVECSFMRKDVPGAVKSTAQKVWNREGGGTVNQNARPALELARDMAADVQNAVDLVKQVEARYSVARPSVTIAGYLGLGLVAYREVVEHPEVFNAVIVRTGQFRETDLPKDVSRGVDTPICIIYGAKEPEQFISFAKSAANFFKERHYKHVTIEEIPNSGVDYRPEIVTNYFLAGDYEKAGPDRQVFERLTNRAAICLIGDADPDTLPMPDFSPKSDTKAAPKAPPKEAVPDGRKPVDPAKALAALDAFVEAHPKAKDLIPYCRFISARLLHEKLHDDAKAQELLREFIKPPFLADPAAPEALLYLVDKVLGPTADSKESLALLQQAQARPSVRPATAARIKELIHQLLAEKKP